MVTGNNKLAVILSLEDQFSKGLKNAGKSISDFGNRARQAGVSLGIIGGVGVAATVTLAKAASDITESVNAVNVVFGDAADQVLEFGQNSATSVGLATAEFNQLSAITGALLKDVGLPMGQVAGLTNDLTVRAADLASVFNTSVQDALGAINQALRGETEAIRRYTGDVTDATLEQYALAKGIQTSVADMTQQEKRLLRAEVLMQQTAFAAGDFANTSDSLANKQRILAAQLTNLRAVLGQALIPALTEIANKVGTVIANVVEWAKENPELARKIVIITAAVSALVAGLGIALIVIGQMALGIGALVTVFGVLLGPVGLIALAIVGLVAGGVLLIKNWESVRDVARTVFVFIADNVLKPFITYYTEVIGRMLNGIAAVINAAQGLANFFGAEWNQGISDALNNASKSMRDFDFDSKAAFDSVDGAITTFRDNTEEKINDIKGFFSGLSDSQKGFADDAVIAEQNALDLRMLAYEDFGDRAIEVEEGIAKAQALRSKESLKLVEARFRSLREQVNLLPAVIGATNVGPQSQFAQIRSAAAATGGLMDAFGNPIVPGHPLYDQIFGALGVNAALPVLPGTDVNASAASDRNRRSDLVAAGITVNVYGDIVGADSAAAEQVAEAVRRGMVTEQEAG